MCVMSHLSETHRFTYADCVLIMRLLVQMVGCYCIDFACVCFDLLSVLLTQLVMLCVLIFKCGPFDVDFAPDHVAMINSELI